MPTIKFGTRDEANRVRDLSAVMGYLSISDDRRSKSVKLQSGTPDDVVERVREEAFDSQRDSAPSAGMTELTDAEKSSLRATGRFEWRKHGLAAMRAKAALEQRGATDWQDFYEPGEGVGGALKNLRASKERSARTGAGIGVGGQRTDMEEVEGRRRQRKQSERARASQVSSAKEPAILARDADAQEFIEQEQGFGTDVWDITFTGSDRYGRPDPSGRDFELLEERNEQRSERAQQTDDLRSAEKTRDPVKWANAPDEYDYPGIDTVDPEKKHAARSEKAQQVDENELADIAESVDAWANDMDDTDLPGIDTPADADFDDVF